MLEEGETDDEEEEEEVRVSPPPAASKVASSDASAASLRRGRSACANHSPRLLNSDGLGCIPFIEPLEKLFPLANTSGRSSYKSWSSFVVLCLALVCSSSLFHDTLQLHQFLHQLLFSGVIFFMSLLISTSCSSYFHDLLVEPLWNHHSFSKTCQHPSCFFFPREHGSRPLTVPPMFLALYLFLVTLALDTF